MPRHQQVTTCRRNGGPILRRCTCEHCNLPMCSVCGASGDALTTDCPGTKVAFDKQCEALETCLDYTDDRGWHQGVSAGRRSPRFMNTKIPPPPPRTDPRTIIAPTIDWTKVDQNKALQHELTLLAIDWALADRQCDDLSAKLVSAKDAPLTPGETGSNSLESIQESFQSACRRVEACDDELKQAARKLVTALEGPLMSPPP
jgi:hypothetical protein